MIYLAALVSATAALTLAGARVLTTAHGSASHISIGAILCASAGCTTSLALQQRARVRRARGGA